MEWQGQSWLNQRTASQGRRLAAGLGCDRTPRPGTDERVTLEEVGQTGICLIMAKTCVMFHQKLVQDQSKNRLICWQYFTKRLIRQCHYLCSCDCEQLLFNLLCKRVFFLKKKMYSPSLWSFPLLNSRCCWWS